MEVISFACLPPRVNLTAGTSGGDGSAAVLVRRACAMWYCLDSPAGTKILRGGDGDGVGSCCFPFWGMASTGAGAGFSCCSGS